MAKVSLSEIDSFDELNRLVGYKNSEPYEDYYAPMQINQQQKQKRIDLAKLLEDVFEGMLVYMFEMNRHGYSDSADEYIRAKEYYIAIISRFVTPDSYLISHADAVIANVLTVLNRHADDPWFYSSDRARALSENEANAVFNHTEYEESVKNKRFKTWHTIMDGRERDSHAEMNGVTLPIAQPFELRGGYMQYPLDTSLGVSADEWVNCRCSLTVS